MQTLSIWHPHLRERQRSTDWHLTTGINGPLYPVFSIPIPFPMTIILPISIPELVFWHFMTGRVVDG
jgi:hypothetical protein